MTRKLISALLLSSVIAPQCALAQAETPVLSSPFGDNMVVQRGANIVFRGTGSTGERFIAAFAGEQSDVTVDQNGHWRAEFSAKPASGPFNFRINDDVAAKNILVGDVFLCSGQSNMEYPIHRALNPQRELDKARDPDIRLLTVPRNTSAAPQNFLADDVTWMTSETNKLKDFSAVCYFYGRSVKEDGVALGLVNSSWGGTRIESWMSADNLTQIGQRQDDLNRLKLFQTDEVAARREFSQVWETWWQKVNADRVSPWINPDHYQWVPLPSFTNWKTWGDAELSEYDGQIWYRASVELEAGELDYGRINLGGIDEMDQVWVNGRWVGGYFNWGGEREYVIPASTLREGRNDIVVNVQSAWDKGGLYGPEDKIALLGEGGSQKQIADWTYRRADRAGLDAPMAPWESVTGITGIHNGMIAPLRGMRFAQGLWYQGESNAGSPEGYGAMLTSMLGGWRDMFGSELEALIIQLPEFGAMNVTPQNSGWAKLRDEQRQVAEDLDHTSLIVTFGAGDAYDIHPPNKQEVARRAALISAQTYALDQGSPLGARKTMRGIEVTLHTPDTKLVAAGSKHVIGFELCRASGCEFAEAHIDGTTLVVDASSQTDWTHVRYNWADTPSGNLWLETGLPIGSFELPIDN